MSREAERVALSERLARAVVALAARLVPPVRREGWREEWESEIWHHVHGKSGSDPKAGGGWVLLARCVGAVPHALWIRGEEWNMDTLWQDLRFAVRSLLRRPGFAAVAVLTLALGIGANTAMFSVVNGVVLRPLPMPNADRLLYMYGRMYQGVPIAAVSPPDYLAYRESAEPLLEELGAYAVFSSRVVYDGGEQPEELVTRRCTGNFLATLGVEPFLGRSFTPEETGAESSDAVMISYGLWQRLFASDPDVVGRTLRYDGEAHTVVGVLPPRLGFQDGVDVWQPLAFGSEGYQSRGAHFLRPLALPRPGVTREQVQEAFDAISARLEAAYPETNTDWYPPLMPLQQEMLGSTRPALILMMGAVGLVLLIACLNVGNLLIARSTEREGELAVRTALGASRGRVSRQLLVESFVLSTVAAAVGLILAGGGIAMVKRLAPSNVPRLDQVTMDGRVLLVTLAVTIGASVVFGLMPGWALGRRRLADAMGGAGGGRTPRRRARLRTSLVVAEVALSFVLLVGASLLTRSFVALRSVDTGFDERGVLTVPLSITERDVPTRDEVIALEDRIHDRVAALPDVESVALTNVLPMSGSGGDTYVYAEGRPPEQIRNVENTAEVRAASEDFFDAMGIRLVAGRTFTRSDTRETELGTVINERLARRLWPGEDPVGKGLVVWLDTLTTHRVIGVVGDVHQYSPGRPPREEFYLSTRQTGPRGVTLVVKGRSGAPRVDEVRAAVREVDPRQPLSRATTMEDYLGDVLAPGRFQALLLGIFAGLAVVLAAVGLYGVLAQVVVERRREIGVRMAMGAAGSSVVRMVVRQGVRVALVGVVLGGLGAAATARLLDSLLFGVEPLDPVAFALTPVLLVTVVLLASWLPARKAARVDPMHSLRGD